MCGSMQLCTEDLQKRLPQSLHLKCKGRGMQKSIFSIPVASRTPGILPLPVQADSAVFGVPC